ncbi:MAG: aldo/keto reductase [Lentimicrobium sp.]|jgi:aryl-alcohol dehydrogenase-like predicted oxidoreductase|nr:aldo/keto reductase [Lentimicrobium sp.]
MQKVTPGNTDLNISPIVLGGNVFGWTLNEKESFDVLDAALELGIGTIDTADTYSHWAPGNVGGESETIIGKWMKEHGNRDRITLITKVGGSMGPGENNVSASYILKEVETSLRRLQVERIDLYFTHWDDNKTPVEETLGAYQKLISAGKVRYIGASNLTPTRLKASLKASREHNLPRYEVFQPGYNLCDRSEFEEGVGPICKENGLGVITYYSLASGFLTGKYRSEQDFGKSVRGGAMKKYLNGRGKRILSALDKFARERGVSQTAVSLAWLIQNPLVSAPIASATSRLQLNAFAEAMKIELTSDEIHLLNQASD